MELNTPGSAMSPETSPSNPRTMAAGIVHRHGWLPVAAALICAAALLIAIGMGLDALAVAAGAALLASVYVWGYATHMRRHIDWAPLMHLKRRQYAEVWNALAASPREARAATCGHADEPALSRSAEPVHANLNELAEIRPEDDILEIGCGVGRIGLGLAPRIRSWTGADISSNMLATAADRLAGLHNVRLVQLRGFGLEELPDASFDLVYSVNAFPHLDDMDRWRYIEEAFRVLRPGGRILIDNLDLESDAGWDSFVRSARQSQELERPPYSGAFGTCAEFTAYARRAGFDSVACHKRPPLLVLIGVKSR